MVDQLIEDVPIRDGDTFLDLGRLPLGLTQAPLWVCSLPKPHCECLLTALIEAILGSGVGQIVLQVAAAMKCRRCYGIERSETPCRYAKVNLKTTFLLIFLLYCIQTPLTLHLSYCIQMLLSLILHKIPQAMEREFIRWMKFYGKPYSEFKILKGDFLEERFRSIIQQSS